MIQGGAGTSSNMNANEVIANIALEKMGHAGAYQSHPNDDVNKSQSTNDVYPTALRLATLRNVDSLTSNSSGCPMRSRPRPPIRPRPQGRAHAAPGRRAHDPRAGVPVFRQHDRGGYRADRGDLGSCSGK